MNPSAEQSPPLHQVFVDYENVHSMDETLLGLPMVKFTLLLGPHQSKLDVGLVEKMLAHAASVKLVRMTSSGKNALDFVLAYYVGRAVMMHPTGAIHIVSKDTGFDPLVAHLRSRNIEAQRHAGFASLPFASKKKPASKSVAVVSAKAAPAKAAAKAAPVSAALAKVEAGAAMSDEAMALQEADWIAKVVLRLQKNVASRPKRKTTLLRHLKSSLGRDATDEAAERLLERLKEDGHISLDEKQAVTYSTTETPAA